MLKANDKKVRQYFRSIVIQSIEIEDMEYFVKDYNDLAKTDYNFNLKNLADYLVNYQAGVGVITTWYSEMRKDLKMALEETDNEANRYDDEQVANLYNKFIERAILEFFELKPISIENRNGKVYSGYDWKC